MENKEFILIDESEIDDDAVLISLYKELLRVIERDIDNASPRHDGFTPWTLLAAMGAVLVIIFGLGKGMLDAQRNIIVAAFLFISFILQWLYFLVSLTGFGPPVKRNRLYYARQRMGSVALLAFRCLLLALTFIFSASLWGFGWAQSLGYFGFLLLVIFYASTVLSVGKNILLGNNPAFRKSSLIWIGFVNFGFISLIVVSFITLPPINESNFVSMAVGALFAILALLIDLYISVVSPIPTVTQLNDLRDDIIFRRLNLNAALLSYRRIREGSLFMEEIAADFQAFDARLDERFRNFETMRAIAQRVDNILPAVETDHTVALAALASLSPHLEAYGLARQNIERLNNELNLKAQELGLIADRLQNASGDTNSRELMTAYIDDKDRLFQKEFNELNEHANSIDAKKKEIVDRLIAEGHLPIQNESEN